MVGGQPGRYGIELFVGPGSNCLKSQGQKNTGNHGGAEPSEYVVSRLMFKRYRRIPLLTQPSANEGHTHKCHECSKTHRANDSPAFCNPEWTQVGPQIHKRQAAQQKRHNVYAEDEDSPETPARFDLHLS